MSRKMIPILLAGFSLTACESSREPEKAALASLGPQPLPAPPIYRSADKSLTFPTPSGAFYCPKPEGWVGSDHGTVVFLTAPTACGGGDAYSSSERGPLNAPAIQVYYGYDLGWEGRPPPCEEVGRAVVLGVERPLCLTRRQGHIVEVRAEAPYMAEGADADIDAKAVFTLVTDAARLEADTATFRTLLVGTSTCNRTDGEGGLNYPNDRPSCAPDAVWF